MKFNPHVVNPAQRSERLNSVARHLGVTEAADIQSLWLAMTPAPLRELPDHASRGHKSLGRIQQLTNRRRFKVRATASR